MCNIDIYTNFIILDTCVKLYIYIGSEKYVHLMYICIFYSIYNRHLCSIKHTTCIFEVYSIRHRLYLELKIRIVYLHLSMKYKELDSNINSFYDQTIVLFYLLF